MRCQFCGKKAGLLTFACKCEFTDLCVKCRFPDIHDCKYDRISENKERIKKENPQTVPTKLDKI